MILAAVIGLAGLILSTIAGVVTTLIMRKPNPTEIQVANDGAWEKQNLGWGQITKGWQERVIYLEGEIKPMREEVGALRSQVEEFLVWKDKATAHMRNLLHWGHEAGATNPPDPPPELLLSIDENTTQRGPSA